MRDYNDVKSAFKACFRYNISFADDSTAWDDVLRNCEYIPVEYISSSLLYQKEYIGCFYDEVLDLSIIIYGQNGAICVWPVTLIYNKGHYWFATNEKEVLPPLFVKGITHKTKNHIIVDCLSAIHTVKQSIDNNHYNTKTQISFSSWKTRCNLLYDMRDNGIDQWYRKCAEKGGETDVITDIYVDLNKELDYIHSNMRKSYKALINKAYKLWNVQVLSFIPDEEIEYFRSKHIEVAGRETRSRESWLLQQKAVNNGNAFIIKLTDATGGFVGESLFEHSRDEGLYSVGVYKRELFDEPVSHVVQWKAIEHMKSIGLSKYKIGQRFYPGKTLNMRQPTQKELSISYFKEGFATDYVYTLVVTNRWETRRTTDNKMITDVILTGGG